MHTDHIVVKEENEYIEDEVKVVNDVDKDAEFHNNKWHHDL